MYPDELELKKENEDPCKTAFLDLSIENHEANFTTDLVDKKDTFLFFISHIPYLDSNIPCKILHVSISSEIIRIKTITDSINMVTGVNVWR